MNMLTIVPFYRMLMYTADIPEEKAVPGYLNVLLMTQLCQVQRIDLLMSKPREIN